MVSVVSFLTLLATTPLLASVNKGEDTVSLIDLSSKKELVRLPTGSHPQEVIFVDQGRWAVVSNMGKSPAEPGRSLTVLDVAGRKVAKTIELGDHGMPHGLVALDRQRVMLTSHLTDHLVIVNVGTGKVERSMASGGKGTHLVVLSPDKKLAYAANVATSNVTVVDVASGKVLATIQAGNRAEGISLSPDGKLLAIGNVGANSVTLINTQTNKVDKTLESLAVPIRTFFSSDNQKLFVACAGSGEIAVFTADGSKRLGQIDLQAEKGFKLWTERQPIPMNFDRRGREIFVVIVNANEVISFDEQSLKITNRWSTGQLPDGIAVYPG
ncbi:MAG: beta-propeller fold lactonase family protein [Fimbriimonadaceae bacterium]|jgi:YVTN family beta-propeller protein|nr:beta-propeller fold lactonase family protein [Fimbriimonadaceae bacterium]